MYVSEGKNCYKVTWRDMSGNINYYYDEGLTEEDILKNSKEVIERQYLATYTVVKIELHIKNV